MDILKMIQTHLMADGAPKKEFVEQKIDEHLKNMINDFANGNHEKMLGCISVDTPIVIRKNSAFICFNKKNHIQKTIELINSSTKKYDPYVTISVTYSQDEIEANFKEKDFCYVHFEILCSITKEMKMKHVLDNKIEESFPSQSSKKNIRKKI